MNTPMKNSVYTFSQNLQIAQGKKTLSYLGIYITGKKCNGIFFPKLFSTTVGQYCSID